MSDNRRSHQRDRLLQRGRIVLRGGFTAIDCIILDLSEGGARLKFWAWTNLPDRFELRYGDYRRKVEVCRRNADGAGVRFID